MSKSFYEDRFFWMGCATWCAAQTGANYFIHHRLTYRLHQFPLRMFCLGFYIHVFMNWRRRDFQIQAEEKELLSEMTYINTLPLSEGKFLEAKENEIKEVFKTIVF